MAVVRPTHLAHADLAHEAVLVPVHARQLPNVREGVLQPVRQLERVHVPQAVLHVRVHHQLREAQNFSARRRERKRETCDTTKIYTTQHNRHKKQARRKTKQKRTEAGMTTFLLGRTYV